MEFLDAVFAALDGGVDRIIDAAVPVLTAYALYLLARARTTILAGVPAWLHAIVASGIEQYLMPIVINAVKAAEEHGNRRAKEAIALGRDYLLTSLSAEKLAFAKRYVLDRVPDWLVSDERLGGMIDAALVIIGRGATKGVTVGVEYVERKLGETPQPPAAS